MQSYLRLFKALPVKSKANEAFTVETAKQSIKNGYILDASVLTEYDATVVGKEIETLWSKDAQKLNQSFHKSFAKVRDTSIEQLLLEQIIHYVTTYGFNSFGVYDDSTIYVPAEELNAPELTNPLQVVVIRGLLIEEIKDKLLKLLSSGIALSGQTRDDVLEVAIAVGIDANDLEQIKNKEVSAILCDELNLVPSSPTEFLRYLVYLATENSLLIKDSETIEIIKLAVENDREATARKIVRAFNDYTKENGLEPLSTIFLRFKPLFLALRSNNHLRPKINRIRKLANTHHKPLPEDILGTVVQRAKNNNVDYSALNYALENNANIFRKIRLANALAFASTGAYGVVYKIRNGKTFTKPANNFKQGDLEEASRVVLGSIYDSLGHLKGQTFYIPEDVVYALPSTEKQFVGNVPNGSYVEQSTKDTVFGIHWENSEDNLSIDLDLSIQDASGKIGWDGYYRNHSGILFSGDNTSAPKPNGASELFHIPSEITGSWLVNVNFYNYDWLTVKECPYKFFIGHADQTEVDRNYTINPNKIEFILPGVLDRRHSTLGLVLADGITTRVYVSAFNFSNLITSKVTERAELARNFLQSQLTSNLTLNDVITQVGGEIVSQSTEDSIDLSPSALSQGTIINLLKK